MLLTFAKGELYRSLHIYVIYDLDRKTVIVHIKGNIPKFKSNSKCARPFQALDKNYHHIHLLG